MEKEKEGDKSKIFHQVYRGISGRKHGMSASETIVFDRLKQLFYFFGKKRAKKK